MIEKYPEKLKELLSQNLIIQCQLYGEYKPLHIYNLVYIKNLPSGLKFRIVNIEGIIISRFELVQMPGCCGICVSTGTYVNPEFRGKGFGKIIHSIGLDFLRENNILKYKGSTDIENKSMISIFMINNCFQTPSQLIFKTFNK